MLPAGIPPTKLVESEADNPLGLADELHLTSINI
jgi:hypothetical protein